MKQYGEKKYYCGNKGHYPADKRLIIRAEIRKVTYGKCIYHKGEYNKPCVVDINGYSQYPEKFEPGGSHLPVPALKFPDGVLYEFSVFTAGGEALKCAFPAILCFIIPFQVSEGNSFVVKGCRQSGGQQ